MDLVKCYARVLERVLEIEINVIKKRRRARRAHLVVAEWTFPGTRWETLKSLRVIEQI